MSSQDTTGARQTVREPDLTPLFNIVSDCAQDSMKWFPENAQDMSYLLVATTGELGELCNIVKKCLRGSLDPMDAQVAYDIRMELVDVFIYVCNIAAILGLDLAAAYKVKKEFNELRFTKDIETPDAGEEAINKKWTET